MAEVRDPAEDADQHDLDGNFNIPRGPRQKDERSKEKMRLSLRILLVFPVIWFVAFRPLLLTSPRYQDLGCVEIHSDLFDSSQRLEFWRIELADVEVWICLAPGLGGSPSLESRLNAHDPPQEGSSKKRKFTFLQMILLPYQTHSMSQHQDVALRADMTAHICTEAVRNSTEYSAILSTSHTILVHSRLANSSGWQVNSNSEGWLRKKPEPWIPTDL